MDVFDSEIAAHGAWLNKLAVYVKRPDGHIKPGDVLPDDLCGLGQWLYADGLWLAALDEYSTLKDLHTRLHTAAADIVTLADAGNAAEAQAALTDKKFKLIFAHLIKATVMMKKRA